MSNSEKVSKIQEHLKAAEKLLASLLSGDETLSEEAQQDVLELLRENRKTRNLLAQSSSLS